MIKKNKTILVISFIIIVASLIIGIALPLFIDMNVFKSRIEAAASDTFGMEVSIKGKVGIVFIPSVSISLEDVIMNNRGIDLAKVAEVRVGVKLFPLLKREIQITDLRLIEPQFFFERNEQGRLNWETLEKRRTPLPILSIKKVFISKGRFVYYDKKSRNKTEAEGINLEMKDLSFHGKDDQLFPGTISFSGKIMCNKIKTKNFELSSLESRIIGEKGVISLSPLTVDIFGGYGSGTIKIILSENIPVFTLSLRASKMNAEKLFASFSQKRSLQGNLDFSSDLSMRGTSWEEFRRTMEGRFSFRGNNLTLSVDLDHLISSYEKRQNFNLVDLGAFFFAGPLGIILTKGYDFASIYIWPTEQGFVRRLVSDWRIEKGIAHADDVALSTRQNRIALKGNIDLINGRYLDTTVAVLDKRGCAQFSQKLRGPFENPQLDKVSAFGSIIRPFTGLIEKAKKFFIGKCEIFYSGSVQHP